MDKQVFRYIYMLLIGCGPVLFRLCLQRLGYFHTHECWCRCAFVFCCCCIAPLLCSVLSAVEH